MAISVTQAFKDALKGPVDRSQLKVEVLFSGSTWTDITAFVEEMSGTQEELSQLSGGASANTLNLTLINDDGRFSPKNTASPYTGNLLPNKPIRVSSVYGSESVRLFTGYVSNWIPNAKSRNCQVTAEDAARILRRRDIVEETVFNPDAPTSGYYLTRVIERAAWLSGLRWDTCNTKTDTSGNVWAYSDHDGTAITVNKSGGAARATYTLGGALVMTLDLVDLLMPVAPLKGKALAVLDQLAKVVDGAIYFDAQGQLVFRSRMYRNDSTLTSVETLTVSSLEDATAQINFEDSRWAQIVNRATVRSTPYTFRTDTTGAVIEEEIPFKGDLFGKYYFAASEEYPAGSDADLYCEIPNGIKLFKTASYPTAANLVLRSVDNADPTKETNSIKFKSGFPVFEQTRIKVAFENTGASAERIQMLTFRGKLMRPVQKCQSIQRNEASIALYDQRDKEVSNDLIPNAGSCKNLAAWLVEDGRNPKTVLTLPVMFGIPWLELGDKITVSETITNTVPVSEDFIVRRISWRRSLAAFAFTIEACSPAADFTVSSLPVAVVNVETSNQNHNGVEQGSIPPQMIDGTQALVGLNNIPAFANILGKVKKMPLLAITGLSDDVVFDGSDLYLSDNSSVGPKYIYQINPMTGAVIATKASPDASSRLGEMVTNSNLLFVGDRGIDKILAINTSSFASGSWSVKADLTTTSMVPYDLLIVGSKFYAFTISTADNKPYINVWNGVSTTQQDIPNVQLPLADVSGWVPQAATDGKYVYACVYTTQAIARFDPATNTVEKEFIKLTGTERPMGIAHDGRSLWISTTDGRLLRFLETPSGIVRDSKELYISYNGRLLFDGTYLWACSVAFLTQISTSGAVIATYETGTMSAGGIAFDGSAIWFTDYAQNLYRVPRIVSGRQF